ncbi:glutamate cyclase domain-containing protein [Pseudarthrobacter sp. efr-133-R2A-89]|uniref:glutamate cyclase domain-containing protein n=1 Tax=Pseudarthrobacter sp. efr-133-R2A-89 TaxID=3040302 RepID=UPI002552D171|nr:glutamate cyclase domain-containing protein [Pseudarthrobacter sp. efr-133-R2A-89]
MNTSPKTHSAEAPTAAPVADERHLAAIMESLDRLMSIEIRPADGKLPAGIVAGLYGACRDYFGEPLTGVAERRLRESVANNSTVLIATGAGIGPWLPQGETDGPMGAAALGRAITLTLRAKVVMVTEARHAPAVRAAVDALTYPAGFKPEIELVEPGEREGRQASQRLVTLYHPAAVVFVERDGPGSRGRFHGVRGDCRSADDVAQLHHLANLAARSSILTIGIGDGGNEIGFGAHRRRIASRLPGDGICRAGCDSGIYTVTKTQVTVSASVSNWGAYALAAALAASFRLPEACHTGAAEEILLKACLEAGARDGATGTSALQTDGIPLATHQHVIALMEAVAATTASRAQTVEPQPIHIFNTATTKGPRLVC